jgi:hypothetical protein
VDEEDDDDDDDLDANARNKDRLWCNCHGTEVIKIVVIMIIFLKQSLP